MSSSLSQKTALVVGVGGLGCPAAWALVESGIGRLVLADDDTVDISNLHRQILFDEADIGKNKLEAAQAKLSTLGNTEIELHRGRFLPESAGALTQNADIIVEGSDNFATKFLAADAGYLHKTPVVHGAAIRFMGTAWLVPPGGNPCYRCLFEDILPPELSPNCSEGGVVGPLVGIVGALMAELAVRCLKGEDESVAGRIFSINAERKASRKESFRSQRLHARDSCNLCGPKASISDLSRNRYVAPSCAS